MADINILLILAIIIGVIFFLFYLQGLFVTIDCLFSHGTRAYEMDYFYDCARTWGAVVKFILYIFGVPLSILMIIGVVQKNPKWVNYWIIVAVIIAVVSLIIAIVIFLSVSAELGSYLRAALSCVICLVLIYIVYLEFEEIGGSIDI